METSADLDFEWWRLARNPACGWRGPAQRGMIVIGLPYAAQEQMRVDKITGGSPYSVTTIVGGDGRPSTPGKPTVTAIVPGGPA